MEKMGLIPQAIEALELAYPFIPGRDSFSLEPKDPKDADTARAFEVLVLNVFQSRKDKVGAAIVALKKSQEVPF